MIKNGHKIPDPVTSDYSISLGRRKNVKILTFFNFFDDVSDVLF